MNKMQQQVEDFHRKFDQKIGAQPALSEPEFRADLIEEEAKETVDSLRAGNIIEAIDGMCDLLYVVFGTAVTMGIDLQRFFDEVHRTNMLKEGGGKRLDGKVLKPAGWEGPRIREILDMLRAIYVAEHLEKRPGGSEDL